MPSAPPSASLLSRVAVLKKTPRFAENATARLHRLVTTAAPDLNDIDNLLPAGNAAHIGQMVRNTLVAVDAGLFVGEQKALMRDGSAW